MGSFLKGVLLQGVFGVLELSELFEAIWNYLELCGSIWSHWTYLELFEVIWNSLELFGFWVVLCLESSERSGPGALISSWDPRLSTSQSQVLTPAVHPYHGPTMHHIDGGSQSPSYSF